MCEAPRYRSRNVEVLALVVVSASRKPRSHVREAMMHFGRVRCSYVITDLVFRRYAIGDGGRSSNFPAKS